MTLRVKNQGQTFWRQICKKNGNSYDVWPIGFTLDDLERLKVKVTNEAVTAIGMCVYTPVGLTGVLVISCFMPLPYTCIVFTLSVSLSMLARLWSQYLRPIGNFSTFTVLVHLETLMNLSEVEVKRSEVKVMYGGSYMVEDPRWFQTWVNYNCNCNSVVINYS